MKALLGLSGGAAGTVRARLTPPRVRPSSWWRRGARARAAHASGLLVKVPLGLFLAVAMFIAPGLAAEVQQVGPAAGSLVVAGGALRDPAVFARFVELAGGPSAPIVVIPTAGGGAEYDEYFRGRRPFEEAGARHVSVLHTYDPQVADSEAFAAPLREARGVWFTGGRQWRLADAYLGTETHEALWDVLDRGGVIGGSSAGASIQGSYLVRGDSRTNTIMMGDHEVGLGFLKDVAIDQHLLRRNRHFDLIEVIRAKPELLGIGLDENTAIVVQGDRFEVVGQSYAVIYDAQATLDTGGLFYFLAPGDRYDMAAREAFRPSRDENPLGRVVRKPWPPGPPPGP